MYHRRTIKRVQRPDDLYVYFFARKQTTKAIMTAYLLSHLQLTTGDSVIGEKNLILDLFL